MRLIGFSTSLTWGAPGHYLPVHFALNNEFKKLDQNAIYIGGDSTNGNEVWWQPWAPTSLRTRPNFVSLKKIKELTNLVGDKDGVLIDYEGRISHIFLLSYITRSTNTIALLNFHYTSELSNFTNSRFGALLFKLTIYFANRLSGQKLIFTTESDQLSSELEKKIGLRFPAFPAFSVLEKPSLYERENWKEENFIWVICRIEKESVEITAIENMIERNPHRIFLIHGLNENLERRLSKFKNIIFQEMFVSSENYRKSLFSCSSVMLIYDTGMYRNHSSGRLLDCIMFEKQLIVIEGMPIPGHAVNLDLVKVRSLNELSSIDLSQTNKRQDLESRLLPNAAWAVKELTKIVATANPGAADTRVIPRSVFKLLWMGSLLIRLVSSAYWRFIKIFS